MSRENIITLVCPHLLRSIVEYEILPYLSLRFNRHRHFCAGTTLIIGSAYVGKTTLARNIFIPSKAAYSSYFTNYPCTLTIDGQSLCVWMASRCPESPLHFLTFDDANGIDRVAQVSELVRNARRYNVRVIIIVQSPVFASRETRRACDSAYLFQCHSPTSSDYGFETTEIGLFYRECMDGWLEFSCLSEFVRRYREATRDGGGIFASRGKLLYSFERSEIALGV